MGIIDRSLEKDKGRPAKPAGQLAHCYDDRLSTRRIAGMESTRWSRMGADRIGDVRVIGLEMYVDFLTSFVAATCEGRPMPRTNLDMAYRMHRMLFVADAAATIGCPIRICDDSTKR